MKLSIFRRNKVQPSLVARDTTSHSDRPDFSILYRNGRPDRLVVHVNWSPSDGALLSTPGKSVFHAVVSRYPELSTWRTEGQALDTYIGNIVGFTQSTAEEMSIAVQKSITTLLDDWQWFGTMLRCYKEDKN